MRSPDSPVAAPETILDGNASIFAALGDATRLRLVTVLCAGGMLSIAHLTEGTAITRQAVTKHLQVLADAGLVSGTKVGREHLWALNPEPLKQARSSLDHIAAHWDSALQRLKLAVEA